MQIKKQLKQIYIHPDDIDLVVGGSLENSIPNTLVGPTYHCILLKQFKKTRTGDRFWFENGAFTKTQLRELRKTSISRLFCDNGRNIKFMQAHGFNKIFERCGIIHRKNLLKTYYFSQSVWFGYT